MRYRIDELRDAVQAVIRSHDEWRNDNSEASILPSEQMRQAAFDAEREFERGPVPRRAVNLFAAVVAYADQWRQYETDQERDGQPRPSFWRAYNQILHLSDSVKPRKMKRVEPVRDLLAMDSMPTDQVAKMYGGNRGPFMEDGVVLEHLLRQERDNPGSVIPADWTHPDNEIPADELIPAIGQPEPVDIEATREAKALQLLREGQFVDVIADVCKLPLERVEALASENGLAVQVRDHYGDRDLLNEKLSSSDAAMVEGNRSDGVDDKPTGDDGPHIVAEDLSDEELMDAIADIQANATSELDASAIRKVLSEEYGADVTVQKVVALLRKTATPK